MIEGVFYLESQGNNKTIVKKALDDLIVSMKKEKGLTVKSAAVEEPVEDGANFSTNAEVTLSFEGLMDYFMSAIRFVPYGIVLDAPNKLKMKSLEFLKNIGEITAFTLRFLDKHSMTSSIPDESAAPKVSKDDEGDKAGGIHTEEGGLDEDEIDALLDQGALRIKMVFQLDGEEAGAKKRLLSILGKEVIVHRVKSSTVEDKSLVAIHAFLYEPKTLVELSIKLQPVLIEILEPKELELSRLDLQDMGLELASTYFEMTHLSLIQIDSPS